MNTKFTNVPKDDDTRIVFEKEAVLDGVDVLYQNWIFDGIRAESLIFCAEDIADKNDEELKEWVCSSPVAAETKPNSMTISRSPSGYTYVNFNFKAQED